MEQTPRYMVRFKRQGKRHVSVGVLGREKSCAMCTDVLDCSWPSTQRLLTRCLQGIARLAKSQGRETPQGNPFCAFFILNQRVDITPGNLIPPREIRDMYRHGAGHKDAAHHPALRLYFLTCTNVHRTFMISRLQNKVFSLWLLILTYKTYTCWLKICKNINPNGNGWHFPESWK